MITYSPRDVALIPMYHRINSLRVLAPGVAAAHWDGTYRDRKWNEEGEFWVGEEYEDAPSSDIANHLDTPPNPC